MTRSHPHDSAKSHVTGQARYVDDIPVPAGCLHLCFGLSEIACGTITDMDLRDVRGAPGVVAVLTAPDLPHANDVSPSVHDEPLLCDGTIHYLGQPLFMVIADTHLAARRAARLARITATPQDPILTVDQARARGSRFEDGPRIWARGDADTAIAGADHVITGTLSIGGQEHFYLEGQAALALPQDNGDMVVHASTQHPTEVQHKVADAIGLPMHSVRVEVRRMGGGFGGKESQANAVAVACAVAARATGQPCKMRYDRDDDMMITGKRHPFDITYRAGLRADGRVVGVDVTHDVACGWAQDLSLPVADRAMLHADNAYHIDHIRIESNRWRTNTQSATAFRGFGGPQGIVGIERIMDHAARHLGMDGADLRRVNAYADTGGTTPYGMAVEGTHLRAMADRLLDTAAYAPRRAAIAAWNADQPHLKKGIAFCPVKFGISFTLTHLNQAGALVHVYQDGSIQLNHGGTEMGQGLFQKLADVAAEVFGVPSDVIRPTATDTGKVPNTSATAASSGSDLNGMAVQAACLTIRDRMAQGLAERRGHAPTDVRFAEGMVTIGADQIPFARAVQETYEARISLSATGFYATPGLEWDRIAGRGQPFLYFACGCAVAEVIVDGLTGEYRILRADILHDTGRSLNPALDIGQIEGGFVQGAGWLTTEELVWDDAGRLRTHAPSTYKIPACSDRPDVFHVDLWDRPNSAPTIKRSKALGEPPFVLGTAVWLALADAVSGFGPGFHDLQAPATPEEILRAIGRVRD